MFKEIAMQKYKNEWREEMHHKPKLLIYTVYFQFQKDVWMWEIHYVPPTEELTFSWRTSNFSDPPVTYWSLHWNCRSRVMLLLWPWWSRGLNSLYCPFYSDYRKILFNRGPAQEGMFQDRGVIKSPFWFPISSVANTYETYNTSILKPATGSYIQPVHSSRLSEWILQISFCPVHQRPDMLASKHPLFFPLTLALSLIYPPFIYIYIFKFSLGSSIW